MQLYKCAYKNCIGLHSIELQYVILNLKDVLKAATIDYFSSRLVVDYFVD